MIIQHNIMAMNSYRYLNNNSSALSGNLEKLSSGYKINRAGDDAAGLAISEKMRAQITGLDAAQQNVKDGISLIQTAEGALQEVQDMLNRMVELATKASNATYETMDRQTLQDEVDQLMEEINRIGESANFNGMKLLNGSFSAKQFQIGDQANDILKVTIGNIKISGGTGDSLLSSISGLSITQSGLANSAITKVKNAINSISELRAKLGAWQNRLEHTANNLSVMHENIQDAESTIRDTDIAEEMMAYTKNNILIQSSQAMLAQANQVPQGVLQLMQ